jgi:(4S)-4-hydroxy-5-phosphonooxypentane-2,3-dione isomerase
MIVIIVNIEVKPEFREDFINESQFVQLKSLEEPGCKGYDILNNNSDKNKFTFIETFESEDAINTHKSTTHFLQWRINVYKMMACERTAVRYTIMK